MARARAQTKPNGLTSDQIVYLAGMFDATLGLRSTATRNAVAISKTEDWPKLMAEQYGGFHEQFVSNAGKTFWGWFVPLDRKVELFHLLESANVIRSLSVYELDGVRGKLERAANTLAGRDDAA